MIITVRDCERGESVFTDEQNKTEQGFRCEKKKAKGF